MKGEGQKGKCGSCALVVMIPFCWPHLFFISFFLLIKPTHKKQTVSNPCHPSLSLPFPLSPPPSPYSVGPSSGHSGNRRARVLPAPPRPRRRRCHLKSPHPPAPPSIPAGAGAGAGTTAAVTGAEQSIKAAKGGEAGNGGSSAVRTDRNEAAFPPFRAGIHSM